MSRGKVIYPDPETFNPGRFVKGGGTNFEIQDPEKSCLVTEGVFGLEKEFAIRMLFTTIACTIAMFDVKKTIDEHGNEVTPSLEFNPGAPHPFKADIKPRSAQVMSLIRENRI